MFAVRKSVAVPSSGTSTRIFVHNASAHAHRSVRSGARGVRFQSTTTGSQSSSYVSHVAAGVAGGGVVILAGYTWYHTSDLKKVVQTVKDAKSSFQSTGQAILQNAQNAAKNPSLALHTLRHIVKQHTSIVPGLGSYVDQTFDQLDEIHDEHGPEVDKLVSETLKEVTDIAKDGKVDAATALKTLEALQRGFQKIKALGSNISEDILNKNPALKKAVGDRYEQAKQLAEKAGPEGERILKELTDNMKGLNDSFDEEELKNFLQQRFSKLSEMAKRGGSSLLESGSEGLESLLTSLESGKEAKEKMPHLKDIKTLLKDKKEDAQDLAKETIDDICKVIEEKGKKAEKIAQSDRSKSR